MVAQSCTLHFLSLLSAVQSSQKDAVFSVGTGAFPSSRHLPPCSEKGNSRMSLIW